MLAMFSPFKIMYWDAGEEAPASLAVSGYQRADAVKLCLQLGLVLLQVI